jgi:ABC-2 type transport system permease protein
VLASVVRGIVVGTGVLLATFWFAPLTFAEPLWILVFALMGGAILGSLGVIAGIWADKFDQLAAFQNFLIMPLTFLSGVFYSINSLPPFWQQVSHWNPVFYMIDGFRHGFFGVSDASPWLSLAVVGACLALLTAVYPETVEERLQAARLRSHPCSTPNKSNPGSPPACPASISPWTVTAIISPP